MNDIKERYDDNELIYMIRQNDNKAFELLKVNYELMVYKLASESSRNYYYLNSIKEDLIQEGFIGLYDAVNAYREDKKSKFSSFAYLVMQRRMQNYLRVTSRIYNNEYCYGDMAVQEATSGYSWNTYNETPSTIFFSGYENELLKIAYERLKTEDKIVLKYKLQGKSYVEIAEICNITRKQVDNRLQRIKKELAQNIVSRD